MRKSLLLFSLIVAILLIFSTFSFANNDIANGLNSAGSTVRNVITNAGNTIRSGIEDIGNSMNNGTENVENDIDTGTQNMGNSIQGITGGTNSDDGYTATRTSATDNNIMGMSSTSWTWLIFGIVSIIIVALVWYYGSQYEHNKNYSSRD